MSSTSIQPSFVKNSKRIASLDFQRGFAIWLMVFLHYIQHIYDVSWAFDLDVLFQKNIFVIIIIALMAYLGGWAGYFLLISATVNSLAMTKRSMRGENPEKIVLKQVLTGIGILVSAYITESFMYHGYLGHALRYGDWSYTFPIKGRLFMMETLHCIAWCMIINGFIHYLLIRNNGHNRFWRNLCVYSALSIVVIALTPFVYTWVDNWNWATPSTSYLAQIKGDTSIHETWPGEYFQSYNASFKAWIGSMIAGDLQPLFPYFATSFLGSMFGLALAQPKKMKRLPLAGGLLSLGLFLIGGILIVLGMPWDIGFRRPDLPYYLILTGGQVGIMVLFLWLIEYNGRSQKFGNRFVTRYFRRWGIIALSIYSLTIYEILPRWIITQVTSINILTDKVTNEFIAIIFAIIGIFFFELGIVLWSKVNFAFSFEWFIIRLGAIGHGTISNRLDYKHIMNDVEWIDYKKLIEEKADKKTAPSIPASK